MNYKLFQAINEAAGHHPLLDGLMVFVTKYSLVIYAAVLLLMWLFGKERYKYTVIFATVTGALGLFINFVIGHIYYEPRPFVAHKVNLLCYHASDASFPSDHGTGAFSLALAILYRHRKWGIAMVLFAILTGVSRVYVGHHYPFDILGSIIVAVVVSICMHLITPVLNPFARKIVHFYYGLSWMSRDKQNKGTTKI
jgi:undecaprenyl-diphosphatase